MIGFGGVNRIDPRFALIAGLGLALPLVFTLPGPARAQDKPAGKLDLLKQRNQELKALQGKQSQSADIEAKLKREIEAIGDDRRKLNRALIDTAARLREAEAKVAESEDRLKPLDAREARLRQSLDKRRAAIGEVLAALQRIGRRPPPALLASPEDALKAVRSAIMLDAVLPPMRRDVQALADNLSELLTVRKKITVARDHLKTQAAALATDRKRVAALIAVRQKQQAGREQALAAERERAAALAREADNLKELIAKLEQAMGPTAPATPPRDARSALAVLHDPGRMAPAVSFVSLRGKLPLPVNGIEIKDYGAPDGVGGVEKGIFIATRAGAEVTSPADGWVVYAGPFRSYGQLLILNAGGGYHILLAGMERISVDLGQFVLTGEPVAVMGTRSHIAAILATGSSQPVLYVEFRKNGAPVDPGPWWAAGQGEKVRG